MDGEFLKTELGGCSRNYSDANKVFSTYCNYPGCPDSGHINHLVLGRLTTRTHGGAVRARLRNG